VNLIKIIINSDSDEGLVSSAVEELPPIQVYTNRGRVTVRQKIVNSRSKMANDSFFDTVRHRPTAKISNISFVNPFWEDNRKPAETANQRERSESCTVGNRGDLSASVVESLRRTYNIYKEASNTHSGLTEPRRSVQKQADWKSRLKEDRKLVNITRI
jgi:hypothetical protein